MKTIKIINISGLFNINEGFSLNIEYIKKGMLFSLDRDLFVLDLDSYINGELSYSFAILTLLCFINTISIWVLFMEESGSTTQYINNIEHRGNNNPKPTIDIVFSKIILDKDIYFIYNKNDNPGEDSVSSLIAVKSSRLKKAEIEVNGRLYNGIIRHTMTSNGNNGYFLSVKPTAYRRLVETHNLESNGRNLIFRAGKVVIYEDN